MNKKTPVSSIMSKKVVVAAPSNKFSQVQKLFLDYNVHHLPVMDGDKLVGIISSNDVMRFYAKNLIKLQRIDEQALDNAFKIDDLMTKNPVTISSNDSIKKAAELFHQHKFHSLPVVDNGEIKGIVTTRDLMDYLLEELAH